MASWQRPAALQCRSIKFLNLKHWEPAKITIQGQNLANAMFEA